MHDIAQAIPQALVPICFCILLGWIAGRTKLMAVEHGRALARFVVLFALPIALFLAASKANPADIFNLRILLALLVGFGITFLIGLIAGHRIFRHKEAESVLQALACSFPNIAYCGPPVLIASVGSSAVLMVVTGNLIVTLIIVPVALIILARSAQDEAHKISLFKALLNAVKQPLVFLPVSGACAAALGLTLPHLASSAVEQIGAAAGGVALFALGLTLSGIPIRFSGEVSFNVLVKNVIQPIIIFAVAWALGLKGALLAQTFLLGVLPTATEVSAIAMSRNIYRDEAADSTIASVVVSVITISAGVAVAFMIQP
jgi:malonate transporter and related proteins